MDNTGASPPGTLAKFHLGLAADGTSCAMVFVDEQQNSIACIAGFTDLEGSPRSHGRPRKWLDDEWPSRRTEKAKKKSGPRQDSTR